MSRVLVDFCNRYNVLFSTATNASYMECMNVIDIVLLNIFKLTIVKRYKTSFENLLIFMVIALCRKDV